MNYALLGQTLVLAIIGLTVAYMIYKELQELGIRRRTRDSLRTLLNSSNEDWWVEHRQWLSQQRTPRQLRLDRAALIDAVEEDVREWEGPFMLDTPRDAA